MVSLFCHPHLYDVDLSSVGFTAHTISAYEAPSRALMGGRLATVRFDMRTIIIRFFVFFLTTVKGAIFLSPYACRRPCAAAFAYERVVPFSRSVSVAASRTTEGLTLRDLDLLAAFYVVVDASTPFGATGGGLVGYAGAESQTHASLTFVYLSRKSTIGFATLMIFPAVHFAPAVPVGTRLRITVRGRSGSASPLPELPFLRSLWRFSTPSRKPYASYLTRRTETGG